MLIDWFTVAAQAINFVVLVWLLKRFLYRPVLDAIDAREARIAAQIADARAKETAARARGEALTAKTEEFDRSRAKLLSEAVHDAQVERERLLAAARTAADELSTKRQAALRDDAQRLTRALADTAQRQVFAIARRALVDLGDASIEERVAAAFVRRLRALDKPALEGLAAALNPRQPVALLRSAVTLSDETRRTIATTLNECLGTRIETPVALQFATAPDLVSGVELVMGGQKLAWSVAQYLDSLERGLDELLGSELAPASNTPMSQATATPHE